jgi:Flp pilus assembly pilin Flp
MKKLIKNQKGQGIMEYVIISSLIGIVCLGAVSTFGESIKVRVARMEKEIVNVIDKKPR